MEQRRLAGSREMRRPEPRKATETEGEKEREREREGGRKGEGDKGEIRGKRRRADDERTRRKLREIAML